MWSQRIYLTKNNEENRKRAIDKMHQEDLAKEEMRFEGGLVTLNNSESKRRNNFSPGWYGSVD